MEVIWTWDVAVFKTLVKVKRVVKDDTDRDLGRPHDTFARIN